MSAEQTIVESIEEGAPLYNQGNIEGCFKLYAYAAKTIVVNDDDFQEQLQQATAKASELGEASNFKEAAWVLRNVFDDILAEADRAEREDEHDV